MAQAISANALRSKTSIGQRAREVKGLTPTRALRLALARAAGDLWELPLSVTTIEHKMVDVDGLPHLLDDAEMMVLLDGPDGIRGGMTVDRAMLTSVTEVQTIGAVTERAPSDRIFTPTDAALIAPLADAMLERMDVSINGSLQDNAACDRAEAAWVLGYRFGAMVDKKRNLLLALESESFHVLRIEIDIAAGMRAGHLTLCLPERAIPEPEPDPDPGQKLGAHADALSTVPTKLSATLPSFQTPLSKASSLKVGDVLPLDPDTLNKVILRGADGRIVARCALGKVNEFRALRVLPRSGQRAALAADAGPGAGLEAGLGENFSTPQIGAVDTSPVATPQVPQIPLDDIPVDTSADVPVNVDDIPLPDLPPLDFDAEDPLDALGGLDVGNASFE